MNKDKLKDITNDSKHKKVIINGISVPESLLLDIKAGKVVIFAGAGVSCPSNIPDFEKLTEELHQFYDKEYDKNIDSEEALDSLENSHANIREQTRDIILNIDSKYNDEHANILKLFKYGKVRIVTTNYDSLFEQATNQQVKTYTYPALPYGSQINGIVHIHGDFSNINDLVMTSKDFGKGYLVERRITSFLLEMFDNYTVLFIGYSFNDVFSKYLLRAIPKDKLQNVYNLTNDHNVKKWKRHGIHPILYESSEDKKHQYRVVSSFLNELANISTRKLTDWFEWINTECTGEPPEDENSNLCNTLLFCLKSHKQCIKQLSKNAKSQKWLKWLKDHKFFDNLFKSNIELSDIDKEIMYLLIKNYSSKDIVILI